MTQCCHQDLEQRPTMVEVRDHLLEILNHQNTADVLNEVTGALKQLSIRAGLRGATGAIAPGPPFQGGPRDDIYLF